MKRRLTRQQSTGKVQRSPRSAAPQAQGAFARRRGRQQAETSVATLGHGATGATHVAPAPVLAQAALDVAMVAERAVFDARARKRADLVIAAALRRRRDLAAADQRFVSSAVFALFRWWGWIEPLRLRRPEARLLVANLLDSTSIHPACHAWAAEIGWRP